ncbi:MAG: hypothetical protein PHS79_03565 [Patescibacteria group bacterium]|nr:hypothetical protein [Patescibacteria group bacterium]
MRFLNALAALTDIDDRIVIPELADLPSTVCAEGFIDMKKVTGKQRTVSKAA